MAGRRPYEPTPADRATVKALVAAGVTEARICPCIGSYGIAEKTLRKHFKRELKTARSEVTALAMSKLLAGIQVGEAWAIKLWMMAREGWTEQARILQEGGGTVVNVNVSPGELLRSRIAQLASRGDAGKVIELTDRGAAGETDARLARVLGPAKSA
jgi:hypothetical protein